MDKYLKELVIKNFQSHTDTTLTFDPKINMITGENSAGKSAVFRAIRFLAYNQPTKNIEKGLLRKGKSSIVVKATMSDGSWVLREKGEGVNKYVLFDDIIAKEHGGPLELNNFGALPSEVGRILGMAPVTLSQTQDIEINMSPQNDPAFMLSKTSPEIARWVYSLTHLDDVRYAIDALNKDNRRCGDAIKDHNLRSQKLQEELDKFSNFSDHENKFYDLEMKDMLLSEDLDKLYIISDLFSDMLALKQKAIPTKKRVDQLSQALSDFCNMDSLEADLRKIQELIVLNEQISLCNDKINTVNQRILELEPITKLKDVDIDRDFKILKDIIDIDLQLDVAINKIEQTKTNIKTSQKEIKNIEIKIEEIQNKIFGENDRCCPICHSLVDESLMEHIIEELNDEKNK